MHSALLFCESGAAPSARHSRMLLAGIQRLGSVLALFLRSNGFRSPAVSDLLLALPKSRQKARHPARRSDSHRANRNALCFSAEPGSADSTSLCRQPTRAHPCARPCGQFPPQPAMLGAAKAPGMTSSAVHPWTTSQWIVCSSVGWAKQSDAQRGLWCCWVRWRSPNLRSWL